MRSRERRLPSITSEKPRTSSRSTRYSERSHACSCRSRNASLAPPVMATLSAMPLSRPPTCSYSRSSSGISGSTSCAEAVQRGRVHEGHAGGGGELGGELLAAGALLRRDRPDRHLRLV